MKKILSERIEDIFVSGYTENNEAYYKFSPMFWWIYIKYKNEYLLLTSNDGSISYEECKQIKCQFDIEEGDLFTITAISKNEFGEVSLIDLFYDEFENLVKIGILISENQKYLFFDSLNINGFIFSELYERGYILDKLKKEQFTLLVLE